MNRVAKGFICLFRRKNEWLGILYQKYFSFKKTGLKPEKSENQKFSRGWFAGCGFPVNSGEAIPGAVQLFGQPLFLYKNEAVGRCSAFVFGRGKLRVRPTPR
jgi:hypothetical protein